MSNLNDHELIARCISGRDEEAWELFVRAYSRLIWSSILKTFRSASFPLVQDDVEDVYSSVFLSLLDHDFRKLRQFESRNACSLSTWLTVVSVNHAVDFMRKHGKRIRACTDEAEGTAFGTVDERRTIEETLIDRQRDEALSIAVAALSGEDRRMYDLLFQKNLQADAAAEFLGISPAALYTRKHRLIEKLKKIVLDV